jgi:hypothetical protein
MKLPNIYTVLDQIDFEKESENIEKSLLRLQGIVDDTKFNRDQILFSFIQKFYNKLIDLSE